MDAARPDPANGLAFFGCPQTGSREIKGYGWGGWRRSY
jgi:hypothetical protein